VGMKNYFDKLKKIFVNSKRSFFYILNNNNNKTQKEIDKRK